MSRTPIVLRVDPASRFLYEGAARALGFVIEERPPTPRRWKARTRPAPRRHEPLSSSPLVPAPEVAVHTHRSNHPDPRLLWVASAFVGGVTRYRYGLTADDAEQALRRALYEEPSA